jgi:predicted PolB exonuclease-like 3'-5' exonuclease
MSDMIIFDLETFAIDDADQFIEPAEAPSNYKKPEAIAAYIEEARVKALETCALDPDLCRIVALGWMTPDATQPVVRLCQNTTEERDTLEQFWREAKGADLVSFRGLNFDMPILMRRSQYLNVPYLRLSLDKYRSNHIDLFQELTWRGAIKGHSLQFYMARFGIPYEDISSGKDIAALVKAGDWAGVKAHCAADVLGTKKLAQRLGLIEVTQPAVAEGVF